ncbi:MAG TPA: Ig-like domain-containing protein [Candidatus Saccharimonadales bacterium]|nr:Ig-like domain-containing protein [Candidatus Saccharimonadales bacterium]
MKPPIPGLKSTIKRRKWFRSQTVIIAYIAALAAIIIYSFWAIQINKPGQSTGHATTCTPNATQMKKLINTCRPWLAASVTSYPVPPAAGTDKESQTIYEESYFGKQVDAIKDYHKPGDVLNNIDKYFINRANTFVMINWKPVGGWTNANAGNVQATQAIINMANSIKSMAPHTIFLTVWHEGENDVSPGGDPRCPGVTYKGNQGTVTDYINMWHYVRQVFNQQGVNNVVWAMDYENYDPFDCLVPDMYPGDNYVDWIVFNGYNSVPGVTFSSRMTRFLNILDSNHIGTGKPLGIAEWGDDIGNDAQDAAYINGAQKWIEDGWLHGTNAQSKRIDLYLTFDSIGHNNADYRMGYVNGTPSNINGAPNATKAAAYKQYVHSAAFSTGSSSLPPPDTTPPTVSVSAPANGATVTGSITLKATASDNVGVTSVKLAVDNTVISTDTNGSDGWSTPWNSSVVANGTHTVTATASDVAGNTKAASVTIAVNNAGSPAISSFTANPASVASGSKSTLSWSYANTPTCSVAPGGPSGTTTTSWQTGALTNNTTFTLTCGTATKTVTVSVLPAPTISSFLATPATITVGNTSTLSWSTTNSSGCSVTPGGPTNTTATSWQTLSMTTTGSTTFTLTCKNSVGQSAAATTKLTVNPAPVPPSNVMLSASSTSIEKGSSVTMSWTSNDSSSCVLNPGNFIASGTRGSKTIVNLQATTTYTVTCSNTAGSTTSNNVKVTVSTTPPPPAAPVILSFTATPSSLSGSGTSLIAWQTSNVATNGCSLVPSPLSSTDGSAQWTTPTLTTSISYTLTCKNSAGQTTSQSLAVIVADVPAPPAPAPTPVGTGGGSGNSSGPSVTATTGQTVTNVQATGSVTQGALATLDPATVSNAQEVKNISKIEFYNGDKLIQTVTKPPFALNTSKLKPGSYTITQRTYFKDGSTLQQTQLVSITKKKSQHNLVTVIFISLLLVLLAVGLLVLRRRVLMYLAFKQASTTLGTVYGDPDLDGLYRSQQPPDSHNTNGPFSTPPQ